MAKDYLSELAAEQLTGEKIDAYLSSSKLKNSDIFKQYVLEFRQELRNKFLTKRYKNTSH